MLSPPDGWNSELMWSRWTYTNRWLPSEMYEDESGFEAVEAYVKQWNENVRELSHSKSNIEHLLLLVGMLSRDIHGYQFSTDDPDGPDDCPSYCHNALFNIQYHDHLMKLVQAVHENARLAVALQGMPTIPFSLILTQPHLSINVRSFSSTAEGYGRRSSGPRSRS